MVKLAANRQAPRPPDLWWKAVCHSGIRLVTSSRNTNFGRIPSHTKSTSPPFLLWCHCNTWSAMQCHFCIFLGFPRVAFQMWFQIQSHRQVFMQHLIHHRLGTGRTNVVLVEPSSYCQPSPLESFCQHDPSQISPRLIQHSRSGKHEYLLSFSI